MDLSALIFAALKSANTANERIDNLPLPMVFKGTLGTGGTIESLPTASSSNEGYVYIVITDGTYAGVSAKAGDTFVSDGSSWVLVPSADEPSPIDDSVTSTALTWSSSKIASEFSGIVKTFTYTGTGTSENTINFPIRPNLIFIMSVYSDSLAYLLPFAYGSPASQTTIGLLTDSAPSFRPVTLTYNGNNITITSTTTDRSMNRPNVDYTVYYI